MLGSLHKCYWENWICTSRLTSAWKYQVIIIIKKNNQNYHKHKYDYPACQSAVVHSLICACTQSFSKGHPEPELNVVMIIGHHNLDDQDYIRSPITWLECCDRDGHWSLILLGSYFKSSDCDHNHSSTCFEGRRNQLTLHFTSRSLPGMINVVINITRIGKITLLESDIKLNLSVHLCQPIK